MPDRYSLHQFDNGLSLVAEQMPGMQSVAMTLLIPAGSSIDPDGATGASTVLCDLILRGAGDRDNRALTEHLDSLGLQRSSSVGVYHTRLAFAATASSAVAALPAYADIVLRPHMPADGFESARELTLQALAGIEDEPQRKLMTILREIYFPWPLGRNSLGTKADLENLSLDDLKSHRRRAYSPEQAIIAFAGNIEFEPLRDAIGQMLGAWPGMAALKPSKRPATKSYHFVEQKSEQTHIGLAWPTVEETDPDYYVARIAYDILGGGSSARLFTEVREKRGLCYSVHAGYASLKGVGCVMGYAGTSNDRAQATLDCFLAEIKRFAQGVTQDELERTKVGLKANTIMSGESTSARAGSIAHDFFMRGRIRTIEEIKRGIDGVTIDQVNAFVKKHDVQRPTIVVLGPKELTVAK